MEALAKRPYFKEIAHYFCELAQGAMLRSQLDEAHGHLEQALAEYKLCTRATIVLGDMEAQQGHYDMACRCLAAYRVAESGVPGAGRRAPGRRLPSQWRHCPGHPRAAQLRGPVSVARSAQRAVQPGARARRRRRGGCSSSRTSSRAIRRCSASTSCSRRSSWRRPPSDGTIWNSSRAWWAQHIKRLGMYRCEQCGFRAKQYSLALPRLRQVGDLYAAAHGDSGWLCRVMPPRLARALG